MSTSTNEVFVTRSKQQIRVGKQITTNSKWILRRKLNSLKTTNQLQMTF